MDGFNKAVLSEDIDLMNRYGDRIIWNEHLKQSDKKMIYDAVKPRVLLNSGLVQLWKDAHYKTHGHEPFDIEDLDNEWSTNKRQNLSEDDILDQ